jgi:hypothetical protein
VTIPRLFEIALPAIGTAGVASAYPAALTVTGFAGTIGALAVKLHSLSHACPGDLALVLVGPTGQSVGLLSGSGGCTQASSASSPSATARPRCRRPW